MFLKHDGWTGRYRAWVTVYTDHGILDFPYEGDALNHILELAAVRSDEHWAECVGVMVECICYRPVGAARHATVHGVAPGVIGAAVTILRNEKSVFTWYRGAIRGQQER